MEVKSTNGVVLFARCSNKSRDDAISLGNMYICGDAHDEILETVFKGRIK